LNTHASSIARSSLATVMVWLGLKRWAWVGALALILSACSVVQSLYNNAPQLVYWWLDDYVDFRTDQKDWVKAKLEDLLAWHRASQLPLYQTQVNKLAELATGEIAPEVGCSAVQALVDTQSAWLEQLSGPLAEFFQSMSQAQIQHLQRTFEKKNKEWSKEWLWVSEPERWDHQTEKGVEQAQDLYGKLSASQKQALRQLAKDSGYDPQKSLELRLERQRETLQAIERIRSAAKSGDKGRALKVAVDGANVSEQSKAWVREWILNVLEPKDPVLRAYNTLRLNMNCQASSRFHALTTAEQRQRAKSRLLRYARDAQELMTPPEQSRP
jgi:Family of unknown function (DUF6279)